MEIKSVPVSPEIRFAAPIMAAKATEVKHAANVTYVLTAMAGVVLLYAFYQNYLLKKERERLNRSRGLEV